ncbi:hypothetical protein, partial [Siminovitchia fortis]|uniref:hypothetical protein n=1 Tax=Siminovitchia fortis TaxID=254758 RepID=UPI0036F35A26
MPLLLHKHSNTNPISLTKKLNHTIQKLNNQFPPLIQPSMLLSFSQFITNSVHTIIHPVLLPPLFPTILIFLFLPHITITLITI